MNNADVGGTAHFMDVDGDVVDGVADEDQFAIEDGQLPLLWSELPDVGSYVGRTVQENGSWCFAERSITMDNSNFRALQ